MVSSLISSLIFMLVYALCYSLRGFLSFIILDNSQFSYPRCAYELFLGKSFMLYFSETEHCINFPIFHSVKNYLFGNL